MPAWITRLNYISHARTPNRKDLGHSNVTDPEYLMHDVADQPSRRGTALAPVFGIVGAFVVVLLIMTADHQPIGSFLLWIAPPLVAALLIWRYWLKPQHERS